MTMRGSDGQPDIGETIQSLFVSGIRLYAGLTLYGIAQLQQVVEAATAEPGLPGVAQKLGSAFDALSTSLESNLDETKKEALQSVSRVSAKAIQKAFGSFGTPEAARFPEQPTHVSLAVDVLSAPPDA